MHRGTHVMTSALHTAPKSEHVGTGKHLTKESSPPALIYYIRTPLTGDELIPHNSKEKMYK